MIEKLDSGEIKRIEQVGNSLYVEDKSNTKFKANISGLMGENFYEKYISEKVDTKEIAFSVQEVKDTAWQRDIVTTVLMIGGFALIWFFLMQSMQGGGNKTMSFGKSKAVLHNEDSKVDITFNDVAGLEEEKEELEEIVDFLRNPKKYTEVGARIPTGVLMVGPPGTGKTTTLIKRLGQ
ncbi:MAG: zinc metalloprotease, partial [Neofamilia sp.]